MIVFLLFSVEKKSELHRLNFRGAYPRLDGDKLRESTRKFCGGLFDTCIKFPR